MLKEDEVWNGDNRHQGRFKFDSYASADLLPGPDDGRSAQVALERLQSLQNEPHETVLTEEKKRAMTEYGRAMGNGGSWPSHHHEGGAYGSEITYSREFLLSFSGFKAPPDSIDRIHWIQQNPTLDHPQKAAESRMARPRPVFQKSGGEYQRAGTFGSEVSHRYSRCEGGFRGEGALRGDVGFGGETGLSGNNGLKGEGFSRGNGAFREDYGFRGGGGQRAQRGHGASRGEGGVDAPTFYPPFPPLSALPAPRPHAQRSSASATGGLSGSVYSFKTREPLGPPAAPRSDSQMKNFKTYTTL
ncbi:hypothetical protein BGZ47_008699 [Haplosporangium gracile]|nr:hypothetical protein BGZ47_008699 [Haplosporangium gracile]